MPEEAAELTDRDFWTNYWGAIKLPVTVDHGLKNDRIIAQTIKQYVPQASSEQWAMEVGCAPGKWLIFLNKELGYKVAGYEYVDAAAQKTVENLASQNIHTDQSKVVTCDFNEDVINASYDVVVSLGFIEHFIDLNAVMLKHLSVLKKGGYLVLGVPNFKGVNYHIQKVIDRYLTHKMLPNHNLKAMDLNLYADFAKANGLEPLFIGYAGGFERGLFDVNAISNVPLKIVMKIVMRVFTAVFNNTKIPALNGYMIAIMRKK